MVRLVTRHGLFDTDRLEVVPVKGSDVKLLTKYSDEVLSVNVRGQLLTIRKAEVVLDTRYSSLMWRPEELAGYYTEGLTAQPVYLEKLNGVN